MKSIITLLLLVISTTTFSQTLDLWTKTEDISNDININNLDFSNRSRCALNSKLPTKSAFILIDNVNPAKSLHRFSSATNQESNEIIKLGVEKFRYSVYKLLENISDKLLSGKLPLLNSDEFKLLSKECSDNSKCERLYDYVSDAWSGKLDLETIPSTIKETSQSSFSCYYLKKFSPIQAHLYSPKPSVTTMNQIAEAVSKNSEYMSECGNIDEQKNLKVANYQIDLTNLNETIWNNYGFEYWSSLKVYFSWAYRYSDMQTKLSYPFDQIFKSVAIEENVIFVPNGCKSIVEQSCDTKTLSMNSMRVFAQSSSAESIFEHDMLEQIPEGPTEDLLTTPITDVNVDILNLGKHQDANAWAENFRNNFTKARGFIKLKLTSAVSNLNSIQDLKLLENIEDDFKAVVNKVNDSNTDLRHKKLLKDELYFTCSEFVVAASDKLSFIKDDFEILKDVKSVNSIVAKLSKFTTQDFFEYYESISSRVIAKCNGLYSQKFWDEGHEIDRNGYHSWYKEIYNSKSIAVKTKTVNDLVNFEQPLLTLSNYDDTKRKSSVVCTNSANCSRLMLDSIIDLYSVVQYSSALLPLTDNVQTPNMFNPIGERTSCKVYDPWKKTSDTITDFFSNVASGVTFGLLPTPVYLTGNIDAKRPVSFDRLIEDGKIVFDPKFNKKRLKGSLYVDFGNLIGLPCQISFSGTEYNPSQYYSFTGISMNSCINRRQNNLTVTSGSEMDASSRSRAACAGCALNFESVARAASFINPFMRTGYFLVRGVYRLYQNLRDPNDIPRSFDVNANYASHAYRKYGVVTKSCTRKLSKGKDCLRNSCESSLVSGLSRFVKETVTATSVRSIKREAYFKVTNCDELITIKLGGSKSRLCDSSMGLERDDIIIPSQCQNILKDI